MTWQYLGNGTYKHAFWGIIFEHRSPTGSRWYRRSPRGGWVIGPYRSAEHARLGAKRNHTPEQVDYGLKQYVALYQAVVTMLHDCVDNDEVIRRCMAMGAGLKLSQRAITQARARSRVLRVD